MQEKNQPSLDGLYQTIWKSNSSPKIKHFLWRCLSNCRPLASNLVYRHISKDPNSVRCIDFREDMNHLLFHCPFARLVQAISPVPAPRNQEMSDSFYTNLHRVLTDVKDNDQAMASNDLAPWIMWRIWKNRKIEKTCSTKELNFKLKMCIVKQWRMQKNG